MNKYTVKIRHIDEFGDRHDYVFNCKSFTQRELNEIDGLSDEGALVDLAFRKITVEYDGQEGAVAEVDFLDIPVEVVGEAIDKHPSFRRANAGRGR